MRNSKIKNRLSLIVLLAASFLVIVIGGNDTRAYSPSEMTKKAVMQALSKCYTGGGVTAEIKKLGDYKGTETIYNKSVSSTLPLPTSKSGTYHNINDSNLSCKDVIRGYPVGSDGTKSNSIQSAYALMGHPAPSSSNGAAEWLGTYGGYQITKGTTTKCVKFQFKKTSGGNTTTIYSDQICVDKMNGDVIDSDPKIVKDGGAGVGYSKYSGPGGSGTIARDGLQASNGEIQVLQSASGGQGQSGYGDVPVYETISAKGRKWEDVVTDVIMAIGKSSTFNGPYCTQYSSRSGSTWCSGESGNVLYVGRVDVEGDEAGDISASFHDPIAAKAVAFLYGYTGSVNDADQRGYGAFITSGGRYTVTKEERIHLYMYYLQTIMGAKISCSITAEQASGNGYTGPIKWFLNGQNSTQDCYVTSASNPNVKVNGVDDNGYFQHQNLSYNDLIDFFKTLPADTTLSDAAETDEDTNPITPQTPETNGTEPTTTETGPSCYERAASLGWILCPIIEQVADAIKYIYEQIIMPFLELDIGLFSTYRITSDGNVDESVESSTHQVWSKIRDMANIGFVIFFIFVIFSQLTGVGIDNYGIKKVLPKLIVGAILINLSYVICQLSVDLSNILGYGIKSIFEGLTPKIDEITISQEGATGAGSTHSVAGTFILLIGLITAITASAILALGPHILIPVFLGLISMVIAIIFCFILLAVRKAFAVLLVIISPLAFMCYILPNTKSLFDKWFNTFKAMLLAFPICSAMIYGGQFVGSLLVDTTHATNVPFTLALCAAVISIMPVFMIPKAIRGSMAMISNGLTRMQNSLTGRARTAAGGRMQQSWMTRKQRYRAQARNAKDAAKQGAYGARRGQSYLTRQQNRGNTDLTKMSPSARAAYLAAQGQVDAQDKQMQDAWSTKFSEMEGGDMKRAEEIGRLASSGQLDKNSLIAGLGSIKDADALTTAFKSVYGTEAGKKLLADSKIRSSVVDTMKSGDGIINQSMGKVLGKMSNEQVLNTSGADFKRQVAGKVHDAGTSVMASQSKDVFNTAGAADYFDSKQLAAGIGAGYSGATADSFNSMVSGMSETDRGKIASQLSASNASNFTGESLAAIGGVDAAAAAAKAVAAAKESGVTDEGRLNAIAEQARDAAVSEGMPDGADIVKANAPGAIETLNSEDGARLRASMNAQVKEALGITGDSGSTGGGGWKDDNGNLITSPAQLTDDDIAYANKLREMSQRGSDGSTLSVDHDSSSTTSEPMRGEHGRGINDATGKERAVEGNRLDYHPKMKGETNADYSARTQWEKEMTRRAEAAGPLDSAKETRSQWQTRAGIESFESWRSKQGK